MSKLLAALLTVFAAVQAAHLHVDHITVAGRDLKELQAKYAALGIVAEYGGKHTNGLTEMAIASFADGSYLELIAAQDPAAGAGKHYWGKFIDENAGPCAWAVGVDRLDEEAKRLGTQVTAGGRRRADGVELKWRSALVPPGIQGTFFPFLIHDETDRSLRAFPSGKPTMPKIKNVTEVHIVVRDLDDAVKRYRKTFELEAPTIAHHEAHFAGTPVVLVAAHNRLLRDRLRKFGEAPFLFVAGKSLLIK